jgi:hypothetical protein
LNAFKEEGFIDGNGYMHETGWQINDMEGCTGEKRFLGGGVSPWANHIQEELNLAYGYHETTSLHINEMFDWIEKHLS